MPRLNATTAPLGMTKGQEYYAAAARDSGFYKELYKVAESIGIFIQQFFHILFWKYEVDKHAPKR